MRYILFLLIAIAAGPANTERLFHSTKSISADQIILETVTDSTKPTEQMSIKEKMNAHIVHFTGAVMSDTFVTTHFTRAFVDDEYSDLLKPGKYSQGKSCLLKSIASSLDGIAIPEKTRLIVYNHVNFTGTKMIDVTGPAIVNNQIWQSSEFYAVANQKTFSPDLQSIFPPTTRQWSSYDMSMLQDFSLEIRIVP